jgi:hypothetical protein
MHLLLPFARAGPITIGALLANVQLNLPSLGAQLHLRHCERSEAISLAWGLLPGDCFSILLMNLNLQLYSDLSCHDKSEPGQKFSWVVLILASLLCSRQDARDAKKTGKVYLPV